MAVFDSSGQVIASNQGWSISSNLVELKASMSAVGAFSLPSDSKDAALLATFQPGSYTVQVSGSDGGAGVALVEIYEADGATLSKLINLSTRVKVTSDSSVVISGIVVSGLAPKKLLIRAVGPTLSNFGLTNALANPKLRIVDSANQEVASNDDWQSNANVSDITSVAAAVGAFVLPDNSKDAALLVTLQPGAYTALVESADGTPGVTLVEVYEAP